MTKFDTLILEESKKLKDSVIEIQVKGGKNWKTFRGPSKDKREAKTLLRVFDAMEDKNVEDEDKATFRLLKNNKAISQIN